MGGRVAFPQAQDVLVMSLGVIIKRNLYGFEFGVSAKRRHDGVGEMCRRFFEYNDNNSESHGAVLCYAYIYFILNNIDALLRLH